MLVSETDVDAGTNHPKWDIRESIVTHHAELYPHIKNLKAICIIKQGPVPSNHAEIL